MRDAQWPMNPDTKTNLTPLALRKRAKLTWSLRDRERRIAFEKSCPITPTPAIIPQPNLSSLRRHYRMWGRRIIELDKADFFISYNKSDRSWAEWIAWQ